MKPERILFTFFVPGPPKGKIRMTGNQTWKKPVKDYVAYKKNVQECFIAGLKPSQRQQSCLRDWMTGKKPLHIETTWRVQMDIAINFHSERHPDPEGIFGAIADAIMDQDKHCAGSFTFSHNPPQPEGVHVTLRIYE